MNESYIRNVVEAALLAAGRPLPLSELHQLFDENVRPSADEVRNGLTALAADYESRGIEVKETAAGFRIQVRKELATEISRLWPERPARYSRALLETLALIAYRQPITRAEIEAVRGVAVNPNILKTVIERNWVRVVGHRDVPGRPELLGTTSDFLVYFGLRSLDELPPLAELKAMGDINLQLDLSPGGSSNAAAGAVGGESGAPVALVADGATGAAVGDTAGRAVTGDAAARGVAANDAANDGVASDGAATDGDVAAEGTAAVAVSNTDATSGVEAATAASDAAESEAPESSGIATSANGESAAAASEAAESGVVESNPDDADDSDSEQTVDSTDSSESGHEEEASEDDELSADGRGSHELVAGPRDIDD